MADTHANSTKSPPGTGAGSTAPRVHEGMLRSDGKKFAIVASRFNDTIGDKLVDGAVDAIRRTGGSVGDVEIFRCPGALEIPGLVRRVVDTGRFDAVICIGVVIRGATPHFDLVVNQAVSGIAQIAVAAQIPVTCGVLACENLEQAVERAGTKAGNRGTDAAMAAIEMAHLYATITAANAESTYGAAGASDAARGQTSTSTSTGPANGRVDGGPPPR